MRLHTNLTRTHIAEAARHAGVAIEHLSEHGSRTAVRAFEVALSGSGASGGQWGGGGYKSATWDEWGIFFAALYRFDPAMRAARTYDNAEHFAWATGDRYATLNPHAQHLRHRWTHNAQAGHRWYVAQTCRCGAVRRFPRPGYVWNYIGRVSA